MKFIINYLPTDLAEDISNYIILPYLVHNKKQLIHDLQLENRKTYVKFKSLDTYIHLHLNHIYTDIINYNEDHIYESYIINDTIVIYDVGNPEKYLSFYKSYWFPIYKSKFEVGKVLS